MTVHNIDSSNILMLICLCIVIIRLPAADDGGGGGDLAALPLPVAARVRAHPAPLTAPLPGRARPLPDGAAVPRGGGPVQAGAAPGGTANHSPGQSGARPIAAKSKQALGQSQPSPIRLQANHSSVYTHLRALKIR